ncbi:MAG: DUF433 domain-containing protein [Dehalococcoidia bacterium]
MSISPDYVDIGSFIDQREDYRGGRPFIVGTGITVDRVSVLQSVDGLTPAQIAEAMSLTPEQVHAALSFYYANRKAIEASLDEQESQYDRAASRATG